MVTQTIGQRLNDIAPSVFVTLGKIKPVGSIQARKSNSGATAFYWRYSIGTKSERILIGLYDSSAPPKSMAQTAAGFSFAAAVRAAETMALEHYQHREEGGRPALVKAQLEERRAAKQVEEANAEAARQAARYTLANLLNDYCDYLEGIGRRSHQDARSIFALHVSKAWPEVAKQPAGSVNSEQFADMMRKLIKAKKGRTANKLRSYARAAYQVAKSSRTKPSIPVVFKAYCITMNPVADTEPDESQNRADKRPLSAADLRTYWRLIKHAPGFQGALLRLHLLTGGQRIEQLLSLRTCNVSHEAVLLFDGKGRPGQPPRPHSVPLTKEAANALSECNPQGTFALSTDGGTTHVAATTLSGWANATAAPHLDGFQAKRVRSGVETLLASVGVSRDIRGRLQSHGIAGVQARHYDGHDYMAEKRSALTKLYEILEAHGDGKP